MLSSPLQLPVNDLTGSGGKLPNSTATGESFCLGHTLSNCTALFCSRTGQLRKRIQNLIGIFLMLLSSQFCKQVRDCGMQKPSTEVLLIYSKMLGIKGEVQTSQKFTLILCWLFLFFCLWLWTLWQPGLATLPVNPAFVTCTGYKVAPDCLENFGWGKLLHQS